MAFNTDDHIASQLHKHKCTDGTCTYVGQNMHSNVIARMLWLDAATRRQQFDDLSALIRYVATLLSRMHNNHQTCKGSMGMHDARYQILPICHMSHVLANFVG